MSAEIVFLAALPAVLAAHFDKVFALADIRGKIHIRFFVAYHADFFSVLAHKQRLAHGFSSFLRLVELYNNARKARESAFQSKITLSKTMKTVNRTPSKINQPNTKNISEKIGPITVYNTRYEIGALFFC